MRRVYERAVCGHIEHPSDGLSDLRKYAVVLTDVGFYEDMAKKYPKINEEMNIDDPSHAIIGRFEALSTPDGKIVEALWEDKIQTGTSSRAQGSVVKNESQYPQYPVGADVVQDDLDENTLVWDMVARPSTPGAFPSRVQEAINEAMESRRQEYALLTNTNINPINEIYPPIGAGGNQMNLSLSEIRTRLSRVKPQMENLHTQPRTNLLKYAQEVDNLLESLSGINQLTESQQLPAADMRGELQSLKDKIMNSISAAFLEAEGTKLPNAKGMQVAKYTTSNYYGMNADPVLDYDSSQQWEPGGKAGAGAIQEPDAGSSDPSKPGPGIKAGVEVSLDAEQSKAEKTKQGHGKLVGKNEKFKGMAGATVKGPKESMSSEQASKIIKGTMGQEVVNPEASGDEEGSEVHVDQYGRTMPKPSGMEKKGKEDSKNLQGIVASLNNGNTRPTIAEEGDSDMYDDEDEDEEEPTVEEALANLNIELVKECIAQKSLAEAYRQKLEQAKNLIIETGNKFRDQKRKIVLERLIENNPVLDSLQIRETLSSAADISQMIKIAEAVIGGRAKLSKNVERELSIKCESDGFYRLVVDGTPHARIFSGNSLWEALKKMGISEEEIEKSFEMAHTEAPEMGLGDDFGGEEEEVEGETEYHLPDELQGTGQAYQAVVMVPLEPANEEGEEDFDLDFGDEGGMGDEEPGLDVDIDVEGPEGEEEEEYEFGDEDEEEEDEESPVAESSYAKFAKKKGIKERFTSEEPTLKSDDKSLPLLNKRAKKLSPQKTKVSKKGAMESVSESLPPKGTNPKMKMPFKSAQKGKIEETVVEKIIRRTGDGKKKLNEGFNARNLFS